MSSGSGLVTRALPRIWLNASSSASGVTPAAVSTALASPPSAARPTSRCSVEMYSSPSCLARLDAVAIAACSGRDHSGALSVAPRARGWRARRSSACLATSAGSAPTARSSGPVDAVRLLDQGDEQVQGFDLRAPVRRGAPHRDRQRVLALVGEFLVSHYLSISSGRPGPAGPPS